MSKGSGRRPQKVDDKRVQDEWERIFGGKDTKPQAERDIPSGGLAHNKQTGITDKPS